MKLIVDYYFDETEDVQNSVVTKIFKGNDEQELIRRSRENENYSKCTRVEYALEDVYQ